MMKRNWLLTDLVGIENRNSFHAYLRIRIVRRPLRGLRREVHLEPPAFGQAAHELSGVQKAGAQNHFRLQHAAQAQAAVHLGRQKGRVHRAQENQQGRIRKAVIGWAAFAPLRRAGKLMENLSTFF